MPENVAVETTKRKFYKALDSITTSSQVSVNSTTPNSNATAKRPATAAAAFDEARERAAKRLRHSTSSGSLPDKFVPSSVGRKKDEKRARDPPNFSPWSHEAFLARLKTFSSVSLWHPKPEAINEVEWAKRGWVCADVNTVACKGGCERRAVVNIEKPSGTVAGVQDENGSESDDDDGAFEQALAERYKDVIIDGHGANCLWRKQGCSDDIYRLQVVRPCVWQPELRKRLRSVLDIRDAVRNVKMKDHPSEGTTLIPPNRLLRELPQEVLDESDSTSDDRDGAVALTVALHGWRGSRVSGSELLHCDACFQRVGLWMYQPGYRPAYHGSDDEDEAVILDLVDLHRDHCPWRNPMTQIASGSLKGLNASEILHRVVSTYARDQRRRSDEHAVVTNGQDEADTAEADMNELPTPSREEVARQDKERESRIRKLKSLFTIKRRSKTVPKA